MRPNIGPSRRLDYELELGIWIGARQRARAADPDRRGGRAYRRLLPAQRLVGARHPGVGISAARAVPRQEFPDQRQAVGRQPAGAGAVPQGDAAAPAGRPAAACLISTIRPTARRARLRIQLEVTLSTERMRAAGLAPHVLSRGSADAAMYWSAAQIVAHHSSNGCNLQPGDLIGTGTLVDRQRRRPRLAARDQPAAASSRSQLASGETRSFLEDGDEITLRAWCEAEGAVRIGFGECVGRVVPTASA